MVFKIIRSPKVRALEKLQKILTRGWREGANGYEQMFWRNNTAILRNPYDLGASKPGSLLISLDDKNVIVGIACDDAGPVWDLHDENSKHWISINTWATATLNSLAAGYVPPMPAEEFIGELGRVTNLTARSHVLIREMALEQWSKKSGLKAIIRHWLSDNQSPEQWHERALYLSEAFVLDAKSPDMSFEHKGISFNSRYMSPWLIIATFEQLHSNAIDIEEGFSKTNDKMSTAYTYARVVRKKDRNETLFDWRVDANAPSSIGPIDSPLHIRVVIGSTFGVFNHFRRGPDVPKMSALERMECIKRLYDSIDG